MHKRCQDGFSFSIRVRCKSSITFLQHLYSSTRTFSPNKCTSVQNILYIHPKLTGEDHAVTHGRFYNIFLSGNDQWFWPLLGTLRLLVIYPNRHLRAKGQGRNHVLPVSINEHTGHERKLTADLGFRQTRLQPLGPVRLEHLHSLGIRLELRSVLVPEC